jgi:transcriptional regulator with XRE-family HTH domain
MAPHSELAALLRSSRARLDPADVGLPAGGKRRVPGLRREELASLAGVSVDYLVRLEQGRASNPSPAVLGSLARALRLSGEHRDLLFRVAGSAPPSSELVSRHVTPGIQRVVDRLVDSPVGVFAADWEIVLWNPLWAALMGDPTMLARRERNLAWRYFTGPGGPVRHSGDERLAFEQEMVAELRLASGRYPRDRDLTALVDELLSRSDRFRTLWEAFEIVPRVSGRKTIDNPVVGAVTLDCDVLSAPGSDLRLVVYTAEPASEAAAALELLRVTGLQRLSPAEATAP